MAPYHSPNHESFSIYFISYKNSQIHIHKKIRKMAYFSANESIRIFFHYSTMGVKLTECYMLSILRQTIDLAQSTEPFPKSFNPDSIFSTSIYILHVHIPYPPEIAKTTICIPASCYEILAEKFSREKILVRTLCPGNFIPPTQTGMGVTIQIQMKQVDFNCSRWPRYNANTRMRHSTV